MKVVLVSTYELGRQPFGLASPAAWLRARGHQVVCADLAVGVFPQAAIRDAGVAALYLPMHTATRLALPVIARIREVNPSIQLCAYGLYAPLNAGLLRECGVEGIFGGEFEPALVDFVEGRPADGPVLMDRLQFLPPDRAGLPGLNRYAKLRSGPEERLVGATEASRGCKHLCRHCPVVPVYNGVFRVVQQEVVIEDIRRQVAAGARHITFGDPDFFNGPAHAARIAEEFHREFPGVSYDVTIKIEHLLRHRDLLPVLRDTGCAFVTSAVESIDDEVLAKLDKGHSRSDFYAAAELFRAAGLTLNPTFIAFTPWTTRQGYGELLRALDELDLVENTGSIQLALRLLVTAGSRLLELEDIRQVAQPFDAVSLTHPWRHVNPEMDVLAHAAMRLVDAEQRAKRTRPEIFASLCNLVSDERLPENFALMPRATVPYLDEPWYC